MKKLLITLLLTAILSPAAIASVDIDIASLSLDELLALRQQVDAAIWENEDWHEALVPQGDYIVGKDIPAGDWSISLGVDDPDAFGEIKIIKDEQTHDEDQYLGLMKDEVLQPGNTINVKLKDGNYVSFLWCPMRITPYTGAVSLFQ